MYGMCPWVCVSQYSYESAQDWAPKQWVIVIVGAQSLIAQNNDTSNLLCHPLVDMCQRFFHLVDQYQTQITGVELFKRMVNRDELTLYL